MSPTSPVVILWIYIVLLLLGGLIGFLKAGSKISLVTSAAFAVLLALCNLNVIPRLPVAPILVGVLALVFVARFAKGRKFMPSGLMMGMSILMLLALLLLH